MQIQRSFPSTFRAAVVAAMAAFAVSSGANAQDNAKDAGEFMMILNKVTVDLFKNASIEETEKEERFRALALKSFDIPKISKFVLGRNWREATPAQRDEFIEIFGEVNLQRFMPLFTEYSDQKFEVTSVRSDEDKPSLFFVASTLTRPEGEPASVEWRISRKGGRYKILDVVAEGVSMVLTLRKEYGTVAKKSGIDGLITQLREKISTDGALTTSATSQ